MPRDFPEATTDAHRKDYTLRIAHPVLSSARISWEWGCDCLEGTVFSYEDYATWQRAQARFTSCLLGKLGPPTSYNPPFDYDWPAREGRPSLHVGPQSLSLAYDRQTTAHGYQLALDVLDACR
jgi:hypothetical protein